MREIGAFEAKNHLSALLDEAAAGASVVITKRGKPVAKLIPFNKPNGDEIDQIFDEMRSRRAEREPVTTEEIIAWKNEGRR